MALLVEECAIIGGDAGLESLESDGGGRRAAAEMRLLLIRQTRRHPREVVGVVVGHLERVLGRQVQELLDDVVEEADVTHITPMLLKAKDEENVIGS